MGQECVAVSAASRRRDDLCAVGLPKRVVSCPSHRPAVSCTDSLDAPYSLENASIASSLRQSLAHNVSKILATGFGRFNNFPKIVPAHCKQFHISLGAYRSVPTCFSQEPNLAKVIARMKDC